MGLVVYRLYNFVVVFFEGGSISQCLHHHFCIHCGFRLCMCAFGNSFVKMMKAYSTAPLCHKRCFQTFNFGPHPVALTAIKLRLITIKKCQVLCFVCCEQYKYSSIWFRWRHTSMLHIQYYAHGSLNCFYLNGRGTRREKERMSASRQTHVISLSINCDFSMLIAPTRKEQRKNSRASTRAAGDTSDNPIKITIIMNKRNIIFIIKDSINYVSSLYSCILYFLDFLH